MINGRIQLTSPNCWSSVAILKKMPLRNRDREFFRRIFTGRPLTLADYVRADETLASLSPWQTMADRRSGLSTLL